MKPLTNEMIRTITLQAEAHGFDIKIESNSTILSRDNLSIVLSPDIKPIYRINHLVLEHEEMENMIQTVADVFLGFKGSEFSEILNLSPPKMIRVPSVLQYSNKKDETK